MQLNKSLISSSQNTFIAVFNANEAEHYDFDSGRPIFTQGASSSTYANYAVGLHSDGLYIELGGPSDNGVHQLTESIEFNTWYQLAVVFNSGQISTYLDGDLKSTISVPFTSIITNDHGSFIGNRWGIDNQNNGEYKWNGLIDEIQIWQNALSGTQIASLYENSPANSDPDLISYWKSNSGSGNLVYDVSGGSSHGNINGASWQLRNQTPVASNITGSTAEDNDFSGSLLGSDADGDALTYSIASNPSNGLVTLNSVSTGTFTYSPTANYNGTDTFTFTVNDGTVTSSAASVTMTITAVNDNPVASAVSATTDEDTDYSGSLVGIDVDGDVLTYAIVSNPSNGTVRFQLLINI